MDTPTGPMRTSVFFPKAVNTGARFPAIAVYSEIYQVTGPVSCLMAKHPKVAVPGKGRGSSRNVFAECKKG